MKKVIALFIACLVCIVGTAVGVAISASHLSEKISSQQGMYSWL